MSTDRKNVIIDSIGTANPSVSKVLCDVLGLPVEIIAKALYNAPVALFTNVEEELANQALQLLNTLGISAHIQSEEDPLPPLNESVDVGVYVYDLTKLGQVTTALGEFLGCSSQEALAILSKDPGIVLGGVSEATGQALAERIEAEVIISFPKTAYYTLVFTGDSSVIKKQVEQYLEYLQLPDRFDAEQKIIDLEYTHAIKIWNKFQSTTMLQLINQSFQRFEIILNEVDRDNPGYLTVLTEEIGMPEEALEEILSNLPVQIEASVNVGNLNTRLAHYAANGLTCTTKAVKNNGFRLIIEENGNLPKSKEILAQFLPTEQLPSSVKRWESPVPLSDLMYRYVSAQLEAADCTVDYEYI